MIKMEIKLDEERMDAKKSPYAVCLHYWSIENLFQELGLPCIENAMGRYVFRDKGHPDDFAKFGNAAIALSHEEWFLKNASEWYLYISDELDDPEELIREDILAFYRKKRRIAVE